MLSILILTYNASKYLPRLLGTLESQTFKDYELLVVDSSSKVFKRKRRAFDFPAGVHFAGQIDDVEKLCSYYQQALAFVFPSHYESFGLPPIEAMACGCPVIVSNRAALPEICGNASVYCDPDDPEDIAQKIRQVLEDKKLRSEAVTKGYARIKSFNWERSARQVLDMIEKLKNE